MAPLEINLQKNNGDVFNTHFTRYIYNFTSDCTIFLTYLIWPQLPLINCPQENGYNYDMEGAKMLKSHSILQYIYQFILHLSVGWIYLQGYIVWEHKMLGQIQNSYLYYD